MTVRPPVDLFILIYKIEYCLLTVILFAFTLFRTHQLYTIRACTDGGVVPLDQAALALAATVCPTTPVGVAGGG